jgi:hypothetical protein
MNRRGQWILGSVVAAAAVAAIGALSRVSYVAEAGNHAVVRLAWRTRSTRVEECRHLSAEELARRPIHMREDEVCEGRLLPYLLHVLVDDRSDSSLVRAAGARADRPLYVYREFPVAPGRHRLRVMFAREGSPGAESPHDEAAEGAHPEHAKATIAPARLDLDTVVTLREREVALVTYDADLRRLVVRSRAGS